MWASVSAVMLTFVSRAGRQRVSVSAHTMMCLLAGCLPTRASAWGAAGAGPAIFVATAPVARARPSVRVRSLPRTRVTCLSGHATAHAAVAQTRTASAMRILPLWGRAQWYFGRLHDVAILFFAPLTGGIVAGLTPGPGAWNLEAQRIAAAPPRASPSPARPSARRLRSGGRQNGNVAAPCPGRASDAKAYALACADAFASHNRKSSKTLHHAYHALVTPGQ